MTTNLHDSINIKIINDVLKNNDAVFLLVHIIEFILIFIFSRIVVLSSIILFPQNILQQF